MMVAATMPGLLLSTLLLLYLNVHVVCSFGTLTPHKRPYVAESFDTKRFTTTTLHAAGMGMAATGKHNNKKKNKKNNKKAKSTPFDANASLMRLEKKYEDLLKANAKAINDDNNNDIFTSEYVICARSSTTTAVSDWVPVVQLCTAQPRIHAEAASDGAADENVKALVSQYCREIYKAATIGAPVFGSIPRNTIQYSIESLDSFHKHVYEAIVEGNSQKDESQFMTKSDARSVLKLDADMNDMAVIKKAYRTLSFELHPDRIIADSSSKEQVQSASDDYARVKLAYETLCSGIRSSDGASSWYESLGGRARTDFVGPLQLLSLEKAKQFLSSSAHLDSAIVGLDPEMVQSFVVRNNQVSTSS